MHTSQFAVRMIVVIACMQGFGPAYAADPSPTDKPVVDSPGSTPLSPDPLAGTLPISPALTGTYARGEIADMLPPRTDSPWDWQAGLEPLHACGDPRWLPPCIPPPPCHPSCPPDPYDLVGVDGMPTRGPRYRGPCCPRTGSHDDGPLPRVHRIHDRAFDWFYRTK